MVGEWGVSTGRGAGAAERPARIRLGMVGGGQGAFIGAVHRIAARLDDRYELVAGAFASTPERSAASGADLGLDPARVYGDFKEMAKREARLKHGIEAVAIVTPNHMHAPAAKEFLRRGIHVICDKPLTAKMSEAKQLAAAAEKSDALFVLTHNYTGYPMVRQAREMVANGQLGDIRLVNVEYVQDWLADKLEDSGLKQAEWRTDPERSGAGGSIGDIGTHAFNLAAFVSGLKAEELSADLHSFVPGRQLDDNAHVMLRYAGGAKGMLWCSQVAVGNENALKLRIFGTEGGLEWAQEDPNGLWFTPKSEPKRLLTRNGTGASAVAQAMARVPGGHPEGYLEAFANIYSEAADAILARRNGQAPDDAVLYPTVADGLEGMKFIDACVASSRRRGGWVSL